MPVTELAPPVTEVVAPVGQVAGLVGKVAPHVSDRRQPPSRFGPQTAPTRPGGHPGANPTHRRVRISACRGVLWTARVPVDNRSEPPGTLARAASRCTAR